MVKAKGAPSSSIALLLHSHFLTTFIFLLSLAYVECGSHENAARMKAWLDEK
jgi:hypothetical protein